MQEISEDELFKANALGWCIEWVRLLSQMSYSPVSVAAYKQGQTCSLGCQVRVVRLCSKLFASDLPEGILGAAASLLPGC